MMHMMIFFSGIYNDNYVMFIHDLVRVGNPENFDQNSLSIF